MAFDSIDAPCYHPRRFPDAKTLVIANDLYFTGVKFGEELLNAQDCHAMTLKMFDQVEIALDVIVTSDGILGVPQNSGLKNEIILWIAALADKAGGHDDLAALDEQLQKLFDIGGRNEVLARKAGACQNVCEFVK